MKTEAFPDGHPQVAQPAIQQGRPPGTQHHSRELAGKEMKPFEYTDKGTMATIGRNRAVADIKEYAFRRDLRLVPVDGGPPLLPHRFQEQGGDLLQLDV